LHDTVDPRLSEPRLSENSDYPKGQFNTTINTNINSQHTNQHNTHTNQQSTHKSTQSTQINTLINTFITASGTHTKRKLHLQTLLNEPRLSINFNYPKGSQSQAFRIIEGPLYCI